MSNPLSNFLESVGAFVQSDFSDEEVGHMVRVAWENMVEADKDQESHVATVLNSQGRAVTVAIPGE